MKYFVIGFVVRCKIRYLYDCFRVYYYKKDVLLFIKVEFFELYGVYYYGCFKDFVEIIKWKGFEVSI